MRRVSTKMLNLNVRMVGLLGDGMRSESYRGVTTDDVVEQAVGIRLIPLRMAHLAIEECRWDESGKRRGGECKR